MSSKKSVAFLGIATLQIFFMSFVMMERKDQRTLQNFEPGIIRKFYCVPYAKCATLRNPTKIPDDIHPFWCHFPIRRFLYKIITQQLFQNEVGYCCFVSHLALMSRPGKSKGKTLKESLDIEMSSLKQEHKKRKRSNDAFSSNEPSIPVPISAPAAKKRLQKKKSKKKKSKHVMQQEDDSSPLEGTMIGDQMVLVDRMNTGIVYAGTERLEDGTRKPIGKVLSDGTIQIGKNCNEGSMDVFPKNKTKKQKSFACIEAGWDLFITMILDRSNIVPE